MISDWRELPFAQIWCVDTEFYPGRGYDNGGVDGDPMTPLCLVAIEMRTGRVVRLWQDELGRFPPYPLDGNSLIVTYSAAEFGFHIACGWGEPAASIDALVEFRHHTNDGSIMPGQRDKQFYSLSRALQYFGLDTLDTDHKDDMTKRILRGPPFTGLEKQIVQYCEDDTRALTRLFSALVRTIKSLPHALHRAKFQWQSAMMESRGVPIDGEALRRLKLRWNGIQTSLVDELDRDYGCYEIVDGKPKWRKHLFAAYLRRNGMTWPRLASGAYDEADDTFRSMSGQYPQVETLRELRYTLSKLKLNALAVGGDNRNRSPFWAYGTKSARCAPSNSKFVFGNAKWLRFLIAPAPGMALVHRDYSQQEVRIAAVLSEDMELLAACESGDVYTGIARQLGFYDDCMDDEKKKSVRTMFKRVVLAVQYGSSYRTLAEWIGVSRTEAAEILATVACPVPALRSIYSREQRPCRTTPRTDEPARVDDAMPARDQPAALAQLPHSERRQRGPAHGVPPCRSPWGPARRQRARRLDG